MPPGVKGRSYDNSARERASQQRRERILVAARRQFLANGYVRTTMAGVAREAGAAVDTVYELVGRKPDLFLLLIETAISGQDRAVDAEDRDYVQRIQAQTSAEAKLRTYAAALPALHGRLAPLVTALQAAAPAEPLLADLWHTVTERRAANMRRFAAELEATGQLAVDVDRAADIIWATNSPELYTQLVGQRSWTPQEYGDWLGDSWVRLLLR